MADATKNDHYLPDAPFTTTSFIVTITNSISIYNGLELLLLILVTFRSYRGLYFWSLFVSTTLGILPYSIGYLIVYFQLTKPALGLAINNVGWWCMITGQSFVLYSRLHLVLRDQRVLRAVLVMIVVNALIFHVPTTILNFVANYDHSMTEAVHAESGYAVYEKVQMTGFCIQEFIISGLYLWQTVKLLNVVKAEYAEARRTMWQLAVINGIIIGMDVALLGVEYDNLRVYEQVFKGLFYSIKLKLEFAILGKLVQIVDKNRGAMNLALGDHAHTLDGEEDANSESPDFVDRSKSVDDPRYAVSKTTESRSPNKERKRSGGGWSVGKRKRDSNASRGRTEHVEKVGGPGDGGNDSGRNGKVVRPDISKSRSKSDAFLGRTVSEKDDEGLDKAGRRSTSPCFFGREVTEKDDEGLDNAGRQDEEPMADVVLDQAKTPKSQMQNQKRMTLAQALMMDDDGSDRQDNTGEARATRQPGGSGEGIETEKQGIEEREAESDSSGEETDADDLYAEAMRDVAARRK